MIISERILKNAVMLGGESLYFFKQNIKLRNISSENITITLDGIPVQKVTGNDYLFVDCNGVTYGVVERFSEPTEEEKEADNPTQSQEELIALTSGYAFPLIYVEGQPAKASTHIELALENVQAGGGVAEAPGWMNRDSQSRLSQVSDNNFATALRSGGTLCRFSVAKKDTVFHDELKKVKYDEYAIFDEYLVSGESLQLDVRDFTKKDTGYIDLTSKEIESAIDELKSILKFQIGVMQYARNESVINNAFNGFYAWLLERAMGDLSDKKLEADHWFDNLDIIKDHYSLSFTTMNSIINAVAVCIAPTPAKEDLKQILEERAIDFSFFIE